MKKIILLLTMFVIVSCASAPKQLSGFDGVWEGSGDQFNNHTSWTIKIKISGNRYSIDYPSLNCGGNLTLISRSSNKIEFQESLTYGFSACVNNGKTIVEKNGNNSLQYSWYYPNGNKGATGTLARNTSASTSLEESIHKLSDTVKNLFGG